MTGYKGRDNASPHVAETPELRGSRYKEEIRSHVKKLSDIQIEKENAKTDLANLNVQIIEKRKEFEALVLENNNKLQAIQREIKIAGDDLVIDKAELEERCKKVEVYTKERFASISKALEVNRIEKDRLLKLNGELNEKESKLNDLSSVSSIRETKIDQIEAEIRTRLRESKETESQIDTCEEKLNDRIKHFNERSILVDTKHTENANETIRIVKKTEELNALIKTQTIVKEEFDRIQKISSDAKKTMAGFNSQRDWIAARNAELVTYERALRVKDATIQEREGKVQQAEVRISGG